MRSLRPTARCRTADKCDARSCHRKIPAPRGQGCGQVAIEAAGDVAMVDATEGRSLQANVALVTNNAALAADIAVAYAARKR